MATLETSISGAQRRVVLIDFDWQDADLMPDLLRQPGLSGRLVAGERPDDAGLRVAELCGLPRTMDLADLTREIFDLAVVGERSARRTQIEGLLLALGTPCASPRSLFDGEHATEPVPAIEAPLALHAAAFENALGGGEIEDIIEQSLPDLSDSAPTAPLEVLITGQRGAPISTLDDFPSPEDRRGLERTLASLAARTGADCAELCAVRDEHREVMARVGTEDALLKGLIDLALDLNAPQVVRRLTGPNEGKAWGAWPFQTTQRRGVLAAAAIHPAEGWTSWEKMVDDLRTTWDERDREQAGPAFPMLPGAVNGWLAIDAFRGRVDLALERNRRDGLRFAVHRLLFPPSSPAVDRLCVELPGQLRDTDCLCRPSADRVLLLTAGSGEGFAHVRRRLIALWERSWRESGDAPPAPPVTSERVEVTGPEDSEPFVSAVIGWLTLDR
ncbi:MAG: hypothetical protein HYR73_00375 [Candidatus Eisenbacteria bacterium]|nr:hypothetical protein [Candidatus Eisenbacteria bacterium]